MRFLEVVGLSFTVGVFLTLGDFRNHAVSKVVGLSFTVGVSLTLSVNGLIGWLKPLRWEKRVMLRLPGR